jgi:translation initiation factor 4E
VFGDLQPAPQEKKAAAPAPAAAAPAAATPAAGAAAPAAPATADAPLETPWTLWYDKKLSREQLSAQQASGAGFTHYTQNLQKVGMFDTVQGFWHHYSYMQQPDAIPKDHNLYMFRGSATPAWETFPHGGCWILKVRKHNGVINRLWEELCFASIGEWWADQDVVGQ